MKKKILILGSTGMLGNCVADVFLNKKEYDVWTTYRDKKYTLTKNSIYFDAVRSGLSALPTDIDYVINCIGIIKPFMTQSIENAIFINALFPWKLAEWCGKNGARLLHITTDCVYSGTKGKYIESDLHDALDDYGKSKSLGECSTRAMVLRTSIIGEEIHKNASLIAWVKKQKNQQIQGYVTHKWNGISTKEYAKICDKIIRNSLYEEGLFHIYAADDVTKYDMMKMFNRKYNLNLFIEPVSPAVCDRTLRSEKTLCDQLEIPSVEKMIEEI